jgi:fructokinase
MSKQPKIACLGEILWDVFPDQKRLGGAPLNVALRLHAYGAEVAMISALGKDALGDEALAEIDSFKLDTKHIQRNSKPTGQVTVTLDKKGSASYTIQENVAWDEIQQTPENLKIVDEADAMVIGSLAFRESINLKTLETFIEKSSFTVFDLNLRAPHYDLETAVGLMEAADMIKLNDEELELIVIAMGIEGETLADELKLLSAMTETPTVCVTLGAEGAMLFHKGGIHEQVGFPAKVVDTVGAGDSFLATLVYGLLTDETPEDALEVACAVGSIVAGKAGANPEVSSEEIDKVLFGE